MQENQTNKLRNLLNEISERAKEALKISDSMPDKDYLQLNQKECELLYAASLYHQENKPVPTVEAVDSRGIMAKGGLIAP